jgi:two-component system sensor kinase FixL
MREGIVGASVGLFAMQISLMTALHLQPSMASVNIVGLQALLLILLFAGLAIGVLTSERQLLSQRLHQHQAKVSQIGRAASMGSFSNSLAHEISQPLTAIGNFTRAAERALGAEPPETTRAIDAMRNASAQVKRAVEITRKLRSLFEMGRVELAPHDAGELVEEAMSLMAMEAADSRIVMTFARRNPEPQVLADRLQIVLVLVNLLRNSIEALRAQPQQHRGISIEIEEPTEKAVVFRVRDNGPGFAAGFDLNTHEVGQSEKPHGLGVGLGICRSIIDAHQGRLYVERRARGASVVFTLARAGDSRS